MCTPVTGGGLVHLGGKLLLERLEIWGGALTDEGLGHLPPLPMLRELSLAVNFDLTGGALEFLSKLPALESLDLHCTAVGDAGLDRLKQLKGLRYLDVAFTKVSKRGDDELRAALPRCQVNWLA
jgi:hypothetical protein